MVAGTSGPVTADACLCLLLCLSLDPIPLSCPSPAPPPPEPEQVFGGGAAADAAQDGPQGPRDCQRGGAPQENVSHHRVLLALEHFHEGQKVP